MKNNGIAGAGVGLRSAHFDIFLSEKPPKINWLEIVADNYLGASSIHFDIVSEIAKNYPVVMHCLNCGIGNSDPINLAYCAQIKKMANVLKPEWISDHLCWTALDGIHTHALLPLPFTTKIVKKVADNIKRLQDFFGLPFLIENITAYVRSPVDELDEAAFLNEIANHSDCHILLDINNLYINSVNHNESIDLFLNELDATRVLQYHLGGHQSDAGFLIDTHNQSIAQVVWDLYQKILVKIGRHPTCVEWDEQIPEWLVLNSEVERISQAINVTHYLNTSLT